MILVFTLNGYYNDFTPRVQFLFHPINVEFFMGVFSALIVTKIPARIGAGLIAMGSIMLIVSSIVNNAGIVLFENDFNRVVLFGIPAFMLIVGVVSYEINFKIKTHNIFLRLGEASYSLYLMHLPVLAAFVKLYPKLNIQNDVVYHVLFVALIIFICFISVLFFRIIEKPIIARLNAGFKRNTALKIAGRAS
jgi:peptidoglycan/LPS O-acetylase OafA/YrhL